MNNTAAPLDYEFVSTMTTIEVFEDNIYV